MAGCSTKSTTKWRATFASSAPETRDELWGSPEETGQEIIPVGETVYINGVPFTIIGMFQHYESEQDRKARELAKLQAPNQQPSGGVTRNRGSGRPSAAAGLFSASRIAPSTCR